MDSLFRKLAIAFVLAAVPAAPIFAQGNLDEEVNAELDRLYQRSQNVKTSGQAPAVLVNVQTNPVVNSNPVQVSDQKTAAVSEGKVANKSDVESSVKVDSKAESLAENRSVQKQPMTVIEASPLVESRIDRLRKSRQDHETQTELSLAEKLEESRIMDERRRAEALFGDRFNIMVKDKAQVNIQKTENQGVSEQTIPAPIVIQQPVQQPVAQPAPQPVQPQVILQPIVIQSAPAAKDQAKSPDRIEREVERADVISEQTANSKQTANALTQEEPTAEGNRPYFSAIVGMGEYANATNVRGNYSIGVGLGTKVKGNFLVEGEFLIGNSDIEQWDSGPWGWDPNYPRITAMNQYSFNGILKYQIGNSTVRPVVGGLIGYTYRTFADRQLGFANNDATSHAVDFGLVLGVDFEVSKNVTIGVDYRYISNLYNRAGDSGFQQRFSQVIQSNNAIEKFNQQIISILGRFTF